jgi:hypothetical protein
MADLVIDYTGLKLYALFGILPFLRTRLLTCMLRLCSGEKKDLKTSWEAKWVRGLLCCELVAVFFRRPFA